MKVEVIPHIHAGNPKQIQGKTVIVIDVFRASSSIVTAFAHGAKAIYPVRTVEEAKRLRGENRLLVGERYGKMISGFDLGNSPCQLATDAVRGKEIVMTTTNGTQALAIAREGKHVFVGCLLNAKAVSQAAGQTGNEIIILCSGSRGQFSLEDSVAAGFILSHLAKDHADLTLDDLGLLLLHSTQWFQNQLPLLKQSAAGQRNRKLGNERDLDACLELDRYSIVPCLVGEKLLPYPS
jgi:2-phosphosulfolactate phosphatase